MSNRFSKQIRAGRARTGQVIFQPLTSVRAPVFTRNTPAVNQALNPPVDLPNAVRDGVLALSFNRPGVSGDMSEIIVHENVRRVWEWMLFAVQSGTMSKANIGPVSIPNREFFFAWDEQDARVMRGRGRYLLVAYPVQRLTFRPEGSSGFSEIPFRKAP